MIVTTRGAAASSRFLDEQKTIELSSASFGATFAGERDTTIELVIEHAIQEPQHIWVPHLAPADGNVMGDAIFRSPAVILSDNAVAIAFIPDIDDIRDAHNAGWRIWLDYDHPRRTITLAAGSYREEGHVFYRRAPSTCTAPVRLRLHLVKSDAVSDLQNPYGMASRWIWERWGRRASEEMARPSIARLSEHVANWAFSSEPNAWSESVWQRINLDDAAGALATAAAAPVFIVDVTRHPSVPKHERQWREPRSVWNQAWFSTQRCANGLFRYARHVKSADLESRSRRMTEIALAAPQTDGLFPSVLMAADDHEPAQNWRWLNSNRRPSTASDDACHIVDAAFTCRQLLEWHSLTLDTRADTYIRRFANRLLRLQRPSGAFPGWVEPDNRVPVELAEGPETAVAACLLFELGGANTTAAALTSLSFLEGVAHDGRWEDFETYYSCAPWGADQLGERVARNGVYKQNTLSMAWCAEAFLHGYRIARDRKWLELARRCVDELALYQAVWDPPWLPAPAVGGFGVMNADCEWNDARQSLFAPLFLELGEEMKDNELIERGVSAVRASFSMLYCPENKALREAYEKRYPFFGPETYGFMMENQGHSGVDNPIGTFTIFTWGNGSALATAAAVRDRFPAIVKTYGLDQ